MADPTITQVAEELLAWSWSRKAQGPNPVNRLTDYQALDIAFRAWQAEQRIDQTQAHVQARLQATFELVEVARHVHGELASIAARLGD